MWVLPCLIRRIRENTCTHRKTLAGVHFHSNCRASGESCFSILRRILLSVNGHLCCFVWSRPKQFGCIPMHHFCEKCLTPSCRAEKERSRSQEVRKHACFVTCVLMHSTRASVVVCVIATVLNTDKPYFLSLVPLSKKLLSVGNAPRFFSLSPSTLYIASPTPWLFISFKISPLND